MFLKGNMKIKCLCSWITDTTTVALYDTVKNKPYLSYTESWCSPSVHPLSALIAVFREV